MCMFGGGQSSAQRQAAAESSRQAAESQKTANEQIKLQNEANEQRKAEVEQQQMFRAPKRVDEGIEAVRKDKVAKHRRAYTAGQTLVTAGSLGGAYAPGQAKTLIGV